VQPTLPLLVYNISLTITNREGLMETATLQKAVQTYVEAFEKADLNIIRQMQSSS
jgi:hypothetical protein